jgi:hypothetical protein
MGGELYSTNLTIGSPPQRTEVSVDTGSSDLWVVYTDNQICGAVNAMCDELGTYDPSESDTSQPLSDQFQIQYGDMSWARGYYAIDTLSIANAELPEVQFGIAIDSSIDSKPSAPKPPIAFYPPDKANPRRGHPRHRLPNQRRLARNLP